MGSASLGRRQQRTASYLIGGEDINKTMLPTLEARDGFLHRHTLECVQVSEQRPVTLSPQRARHGFQVLTVSIKRPFVHAEIMGGGGTPKPTVFWIHFVVAGRHQLSGFSTESLLSRASDSPEPEVRAK